MPKYEVEVWNKKSHLRLAVIIMADNHYQAINTALEQSQVTEGSVKFQEVK